MKVKQTMNMPIDVLYQKIIQSVLADIKKQTGKQINPNQLSGYQYKKFFSNHSSGMIKIDKADQNEQDAEYAYSTATNRNTFKVSYTLQALENGQTLLTYVEHMGSKGTIQMWNDMIVGAILSIGRKRNLRKMFKGMEASYQQNQTANN